MQADSFNFVIQYYTLPRTSSYSYTFKAPNLSKIMDIKPEEYRNIINASTNRVKIKHVQSVKSEPAVKPGTNFCSSILRVELDVILDSGHLTKVNLIVKSAPSSSELKTASEFVKLHNMFPREIKVYEWLSKTVESTKLDQAMWPNYFGSRSDSVILLDDLKLKGYSPLGVGVMMDYAHAIFSVKEMGKFHALTLTASTGGRSPDDFETDWVWRNEDTTNKFFTQPLRCLARTMKESWGAEWTETADKFFECSNTISKRLAELQESPHDELKVLNHGDLWSSNVLFKHDSTGRPESLKFVDFQLSIYNSFAIDLTYFLYTSVEPITRRLHYTELIDAYRQSLTESLDSVEDPEIIKKTSRDAIFREMNRLKVWGFLLLISVYAFSEARERIYIGTDDLAAFGTEKHFNLFNRLYSSWQFRKAVEKDFKHFISHGIV